PSRCGDGSRTGRRGQPPLPPQAAGRTGAARRLDAGPAPRVRPHAAPAPGLPLAAALPAVLQHGRGLRRRPAPGRTGRGGPGGAAGGRVPARPVAADPLASGVAGSGLALSPAPVILAGRPPEWGPRPPGKGADMGGPRRTLVLVTLALFSDMAVYDLV